MKWFTPLVAGLLVIASTGRPANGATVRLAEPTLWAQPFTEVVVFGDSHSDTGNKSAASFCNGPLWVEELASQLGLAPPTPSGSGGTNYAWGGARTSVGVHSIGLQVDDFLASNVPAADQLFVFFAGQNDFCWREPDPNVPASNLSAHISTLAQAGAANFVVSNLFPLGQLPPYRDTAGEAGLDARASQFNALLSTKLDDLEASQNINVYRVDFDGLFQEMVNDPMSFGLTNTTVPAETTPGADPDEYLFWQPDHFTAVVHGYLGRRAASAIPGPSTLTSVTNGGWNHAATWDDGTAIPSADYSTLVDGHTVMLDASGQAFSLAIRAGGTVVVRPGTRLEIVDDVQLEAGKLAIAEGGGADVSGDVVIDPAAGLEFGLTLFPGYLTVDGNASLAGDLVFEPLSDSPFYAGTYHFLTYGSRTGTFNSVTDLGPYVTGDGLTYGEHELTLTTDFDLLIGDLDLDGDVDFFDYIATSNNFGETEAMRFQDGDMDGDGDVDFFDYITVSNHFGDSLPVSARVAGAAQVPEPSTLILLATGALELLAYGWRRRHCR